MKRKSLILALVSSSTVAVLTLSILFGAGRAKKLSSRTNANEPTYTATLNSSVFALCDGLTESYKQNVKQSFGERLPLVMNYTLAKKDASGNLVLAPSGRVFNYDSGATYKGRITNIKSVTATYTGGKLFLQEGLAGGYENYGKKVELTSGSAMDILSSPNYVMISNSNAETTITELSVEYTCSVASWELERLGETYNGKSKEGTVYTLTRNGTNVSVAGQTGTISLDNSGNFSISLAGGNIVYSGYVSEDYKTLSFTDKSGAAAGAAPTLGELNRVYVMDDFESYPDRGNGFAADQTSFFTASNLRGAYYVDAGSGSGATWVSGSGFKIPSTANYLNLSLDGTGPVHGGSKAMLLQGQKAGWVRAWSSQVWDQNQHYNFGRGNRLSFWVHSGRNNPDGSGANSSTSITVRAQVYYQNFVLTDSNRNSTTYGSGTKDFAIAKDSGWNECIIALDPNKAVYAINIMINNSGIATDYVFMPIDDITIYTEPVFVPAKKVDESATSITKSYHGTVTIKTQKTYITTMPYTVKVGLGANGYTYAYAGGNMDPTSHTIVGDELTIVTTGEFVVPSTPTDYTPYFNESSYSFGTWVGTFNNDKSQITINKADISGTITDILNDTTIVLEEDTVFVNGTESTSQIQAMFSNETNSSSWAAYTAEDRMVQTNEYYIEGNSSVRMNPDGTTKTRMFINPALAQSKSLAIESVAFWFYVPVGYNYNIQLYCYDNYNPTSGSNQQLYDRTYKADGTGNISAGWNYVNCGVPSAKNKNIAIGVFTNPGAQPVIVDYVTYF